MRPDHAITAALDAAGQTWECTCHRDAKCDLCIGYAAKAVVAFLRALNDAPSGASTRMVLDAIAQGHETYLGYLAAAVEAAAKEAGDG